MTAPCCTSRWILRAGDKAARPGSSAAGRSARRTCRTGSPMGAASSRGRRRARLALWPVALADRAPAPPSRADPSPTSCAGAHRVMRRRRKSHRRAAGRRSKTKSPPCAGSASWHAQGLHEAFAAFSRLQFMRHCRELWRRHGHKMSSSVRRRIANRIMTAGGPPRP